MSESMNISIELNEQRDGFFTVLVSGKLGKMSWHLDPFFPFCHWQMSQSRARLQCWFDNNNSKNLHGETAVSKACCKY